MVIVRVRVRANLRQRREGSQQAGVHGAPRAAVREVERRGGQRLVLLALGLGLGLGLG